MAKKIIRLVSLLSTMVAVSCSNNTIASSMGSQNNEASQSTILEISYSSSVYDSSSQSSSVTESSSIVSSKPSSKSSTFSSNNSITSSTSTFSSSSSSQTSHNSSSEPEASSTPISSSSTVTSSSSREHLSSNMSSSMSSSISEIEIDKEDPNASKGLEYRLLEDNTYEIVGHGSCTDKNIVVPAMYDGRIVSSIGYHAFDGLFIETIDLGNELRTIQNNAFEDQSELKAITIPDNVTSIGEYAFRGCISIEEAIFGNGLSEITANSFTNASRLKYIEIPKSIKKIGDGAFRNCGQIVEVTYHGSFEEFLEIDIDEYNNFLLDTSVVTFIFLDE
ncbi:MAG: leucine-rich repeat domain-containing protein [Bacilli bacterium]|nr:leucine-rich repeat domain-containing protein [Bacilli bacterium]